MYRPKQNLMLLLVFSALTAESCSKYSIKPSINHTENNSLPIDTKSTTEAETGGIKDGSKSEAKEEITCNAEEQEKKVDIEGDGADDNSDDKCEDTNDQDSGIGTEDEEDNGIGTEDEEDNGSGDEVEEDNGSGDEVEEERNGDQSSGNVDEKKCNKGQKDVDTSEQNDSGPDNSKDSTSDQNSDTVNTQSIDGGQQNVKKARDNKLISLCKQASNSIKNGAKNIQSTLFRKSLTI